MKMTILVKRGRLAMALACACVTILLAACGGSGEETAAPAAEATPSVPEPKVTFAPLDRAWVQPGDPEARRLITEDDIRAIEETIHRFEEAKYQALATLDITPLRESGTATAFYLDYMERQILSPLRAEGRAVILVGEHRPRLDVVGFHDPRLTTGIDTSSVAGKLGVSVASCYHNVSYYVHPQTRQQVKEPEEETVTFSWVLFKMDDGTWKVGIVATYSRQGCVRPFF